MKTNEIVDTYFEAGKTYIATKPTTLWGHFSFIELERGNIIHVELDEDDPHFYLIQCGWNSININPEHFANDFEEIE
jgi:hypothetical protein